MNLSDLKRQSPQAILQLAEEMGLEDIARKKKQDLIFSILKEKAKEGEEIEGDGDRENYAQLRMVALIDSIGSLKADYDCGRVFERLLTQPQKAIELLNWGESGKSQITEAYKIACEKFNIITTKFNDELV